MSNGMLNGVSSRTMSKDVFTTHYHGPSTNEVLTLDGYTEASYALIKSPSFAFDNKCSAQTWHELMDYSVDLTKIGDYLVFATSGNKFAFHKDDWGKYGYVHNPDESMGRMDGWIGATLGSHAVEYVKPNKEIGLLELSEHKVSYSRYSAMTDVNCSIRDLIGTVPINKVGEYVSRIANLEQDFRDLIFTNYLKERPGFNPETEAFLEFLASKGLGPGREIDGIGVENLENAIARTYNRDGTAILVASADIYQKALKMAEAYGLSGEEAVRFAKRAVSYHELYHVFNHERLSEREDEARVGELLAEFFSERAKIVNEKLARYYKAFAKENEDYAKGWREGRIKSSNAKLRSMIESLAKQYALEAHAMGMNEDEARDYISNKLEEEIERSEKSDLEETAEKESKKSDKTNEDAGNKAEANNKYSEKRANSEEENQEQSEEASETTEAPAEEG